MGREWELRHLFYTHTLPPSDLHAEPGQHPVEGQPPLRRPHGCLLQRRRPAGVSAHPPRSREIDPESPGRVHPPGGAVLARAWAPGGRGKNDAEGGSRLLLRRRCSFHEGVPDEVSGDARGRIPGEWGGGGYQYGNRNNDDNAQHADVQ